MMVGLASQESVTTPVMISNSKLLTLILPYSIFTFLYVAIGSVFYTRSVEPLGPPPSNCISGSKNANTKST